MEGVYRLPSGMKAEVYNSYNRASRRDVDIETSGEVDEASRLYPDGGASAPSIMLAQSQAVHSEAHTVASGADLAGEAHTLGFSQMFFKASSVETGGGMFIMEHDNLTKGGPYRHIHPAQDEWLYAMAGEFHVEIGDQKLTLKPGDSVLMPRKVPHVWAQVSDTPGKLLIAFTPAGRMEEFFREFGKVGKLPTDANVVKAYGLERVGPPLAI